MLVHTAQTLQKQWPGCFIPGIPGKKLMKSSDPRVVSDRVKLLNNFAQTVARMPHLYYSQEFQVFLKAPKDVQQVAVRFITLPSCSPACPRPPPKTSSASTSTTSATSRA